MYEDRFAIDSLGYVFAFIKMFKYFAIHIKLQIIAVTLSKASNLIFAWFILFAGLFVAFTMVAHQTWGRQIEEFHSISRSLRTMFQIMLGTIPYDQMYQFRTSFTPVFTISFFTIINYIMLNLLVSILHFQYGKAHRIVASLDSGSASKESLKRAREMGYDAIKTYLCPFLLIRQRQKKKKKKKKKKDEKNNT